MKSSIILFLALISAAASERNLNQPISLPEISDRIAHSKPATRGQFPYLVGLEFTVNLLTNITTWCSGSLIGLTWVLTAAHCTEGADSARVVLGFINRNKPDLSFVVSNNNYFPHEEFNWETWLHDIALIRIPRVKYTNNIKKIKLPTIEPPYPAHAGYIVTISGLGAHNGSLRFSNFLYHADLTVMSNEECSKLRPYIFESNICAASFGGFGVCNDDEGDPMVLKDSQVLIGITSRKYTECEIGQPIVFTRVTSYLDWITEKTGIEYEH